MERANLKEALRQVTNKAAGASTGCGRQLGDYLEAALAGHSEQLLKRNLRTTNGEERVESRSRTAEGCESLHPTVLDRFIQQAVMQGSARQWNQTFSQYSYGSDRVGRRITPWLKRSNILRKATDG